ncbi:MFS transporter [Microbispora sp. H10836]|uniref:MFS transporter n=1 Tax=Microbispora sp. H10836 TaxID=2729106 RepID=UPI00289370AD|nr:MFS transporter [Microbispora sp. H10836]
MPDQMSGVAPAGGAPGEHGQDPSDPRRWKALAVCLIAGFITWLDISIVNVALPSIRIALHASPSDLQWVVSGYAFAFGLLLIPAGRFGDAHGRHNVFVFGMLLFALASAAAGAASGPAWLIVARVAQGAAAGVTAPQITGLIEQLFWGAERGRAFGLLGATMSFSTAIGPLLGGLLIQFTGQEAGWRHVLHVSIPISVIAMILAYRYVPRKEVIKRQRESMDPVGVLILAAGILLLLMPLVEGREWQGQAKWLFALAASVVLAGFVRWERWHGQRHTPIVDLSLFRRGSYAMGVLLAALYFGGFTAIFYIVTQYLQEGLHYSALRAGLLSAAFALGSTFSAALSGRLVDRSGRLLVAFGLVLVTVGLGATEPAILLASGENVAWLIAAPLFLAGLGNGLIVSPNQTLTLSAVPAAEAGLAAGVLQTGQRIGASVGLAAVGSAQGIYATAFQHALLVNVTFVLAALAVALVDVFVKRRANRRSGYR